MNKSPVFQVKVLHVIFDFTKNRNTIKCLQIFRKHVVNMTCFSENNATIHLFCLNCAFCVRMSVFWFGRCDSAQWPFTQCILTLWVASGVKHSGHGSKQRNWSEITYFTRPKKPRHPSKNLSQSDLSYTDSMFDGFLLLNWNILLKCNFG